MTPADIYKAVRDFLVIAAIAFVVYRVYTDGKNAATTKQLSDLQEQLDKQSTLSQQWHTEITDANTVLTASLGRINTAPVVVHDWVRPPSSCPEPVLSASPGKARDVSSSGRTAVPVPGESARDAGLRDTAVADFKRFWEGQLASWRAEHDQWPKP